MQVLAEDNDGFFAHLRVLAWFRPDASRPWEERDAPLECRRVGESWQCDGWLEFRLTRGEQQRRADATATVVAANATATVTAQTACYAEAKALVQGGKYKEAAARFEQCGPYQDAPQQVLAAWYQTGEAAVIAQDWPTAYIAYERAANYQDAPRRLYTAHKAAQQFYVDTGNDQVALEEDRWLFGQWKTLATLTGHTGDVYSVAWSPDGERLASGSSDNTVRIWRVSGGALLHILEGHTSSVYSVAWSPDGEQLASGSYDKTVRIWKVSDGESLHTLEGHIYPVRSIAWSPDGKQATCLRVE